MCFISPSPFSWFTYPCCSLMVTSRPLPTTTSLTPTSTCYCRTFPSWKRRTCATPHLHRKVWLLGQIRCKHRMWAQEVRQDHFCGWWQDAHQRSEPQFLWLLAKQGLFGVLTMFESSVSHVSHEKGHRQSYSEESQKILFWWMRSPRTSSTKSSTNYHKRKIQIREDKIWMSTTWSARIWSEEIQNTHWLSLSVSLNLKDYNCSRIFNGQIKLSERENFRSDLEM